MSVIIDFWYIANIIYFKTYDMFLTINDVLLVSNMNGAWNSVLGYIDIWIIGLIACTTIWSVIVLFTTSSVACSRCWKSFIFIIAFVSICSTINNFRIFNSYANQKEKEDLEAENQWRKLQRADDPDIILRYSYLIINCPYIRTYYHVKTAPMVSNNQIKKDIQKSSVLSYVPDLFIMHFCMTNEEEEKLMCLSDTNISSISNLFNEARVGITSSQADLSIPSIILIIVESLENWPIEQKVAEVCVTPFLSELVNRENVVYYSRITSQTLKGNSGDGQMIINTGLLPISNGVACQLYGNNEYPNIAHLYNNNSLVNPWPHIWNQDTMTVRYGYYQMIEPKEVSDKWEDKDVFNAAYKSILSMPQPFLTTIITVSSHTPFYGHDKRLKFDGDVPLLMERYLNCLSYTDSCIESFCNQIWSEPSLSNTTIIITGDHTTFKPSMMYEFSDFIHRQNLSLASGENYTTLLICSPKITENKKIDEVCYQMDVFPTIMSLIGCEDYYWKGFGVNLLDSTARKNRQISEDEAYRLSDLLIRSNAFELYKQGKLFDTQTDGKTE